MSEQTVSILIVCGSLRRDSVTHRALEEAAQGVREAGGRVVWADKWVGRLPLYAEGGEESEEATSFRRAARLAHGFLWGSPEYHGTCAGVLKNALDYLYFDETEGKWTALVASAGGRAGGAGTLATLRMVARNLHLWVPPEEVGVPSSSKALSENGTFKDAEIQRRLRDLGRHLVETIRLFRHGPSPRQG